MSVIRNDRSGSLSLALGRHVSLIEGREFREEFCVVAKWTIGISERVNTVQGL
jgi:hypothetical protein